MQAPLQAGLLHALVFLAFFRIDLAKQILQKLHVHVVRGNMDPECAVEATFDPGIFEHLLGQGSLPQASHPYDRDHRPPRFPRRVEEMQNSFLLTLHEDDMRGVRGVKSGGPPLRSRLVDGPTFPEIIGESCDSVSGRALPDILNPLLELFDLHSRIIARDQSAGLYVAEEAAAFSAHPWLRSLDGDGFDQIFSVVCGFPDFFHPVLDQFVPAPRLGIRVSQETLDPGELSLQIFGLLPDTSQEASFVDDGVADFLYGIAYDGVSHGFSLLREGDQANSSWGYSSASKRGG